MKPSISFELRKMQLGERGRESTVPDLLGGLILQNELKFYLGDEDEIYEAYGRRYNSYPYPQLNGYSRLLQEREVKTVILENDFLRAVFLPEYGGRLWLLWDKEKDRNLLYTNDVIRFSNLAVRNAWFSGGAEWNIGIIGHSPFTTEPLFTAVLEKEDRTPVLRMYEYERIRQVTYQMDFWLGENDRFLNARMRIENPGKEVVPMYWWSNIAVPEYPNGRVVVPADQAFTYRDGGVYKVDIPIVDGVDVTRYEKIPSSVDYFFDIPEDKPKYIANLDQNGYGILHLSTKRLRSRKLFSWGHKPGSDHWQEFLTEHAGKYVEIQGGLGKTQYGCLPMAPHTAWEWMERFGAVQMENYDTGKSFEMLREEMTQMVSENPSYQEMESVLKNTKDLAKQKAVARQYGSGYGALKNKEMIQEDGKTLSDHLDFGECTGTQKHWVEFLDTGILMEPDAARAPEDFVTGEKYLNRLEETIGNKNKDNWYAHYQLGLLYFERGDYASALKEFESSVKRRKNAWALHGASSVYVLQQEEGRAISAIRRGMMMQKDNLSYLKEGMRILSICGGFEDILDLYAEIGNSCREDGRIRLYYIQALDKIGLVQKAYELLCGEGGLVVDDVREGESAVGELWQEIQRDLFGTEPEIPYRFDFRSL